MVQRTSHSFVRALHVLLDVFVVAALLDLAFFWEANILTFQFFVEKSFTLRSI